MTSWPHRSLGSVATIERRGKSPEQISEGTKYLGLENIDRGGSINGHQVIGEVAVASTKFEFSERHVLFGKLRPNLGKVARPDFGGVCSTDILPILPGPDLDRAYLTHFLRQPSMVRFATSRAAGANLPRLSPSELAKFSVPLPPIEEQRRIATILDQADALRAKRRIALTLLDDLPQSVFLNMFGDLDFKTPLGSMCQRITDGTHQSPKWSESGIPFLFVSNITSGEINFETSKRISESVHAELTYRCPIERGDVLYSTVGSYGHAAVVRNDRKFAFQRHIAHLKPAPSRLLPDFLKHLLESPPVRRQVDSAARGIAQKTVNLAAIKSLLVPTVSIDRQREFALRAHSIREQGASSVQHAAGLDVMFRSLQARAFSGRL